MMSSSAKIEDIKKALRADPKDPRLLISLGQHYLSTGYYKNAREQFRLAYLFDPRLHPAILLDYERAIDLSPQNISLFLSLADYCLSVGELEPATLELEEVVEKYPEKSEIYNLLGQIYLERGQTEKVIALLESAFSQNVQDNNLSQMLAGVYLERGKIHEAAVLYEKILQAMPGNKTVLRMLGELYTRLGQYPIAAQRYLLMFSDDPEVSKEVCLKLEELLLLDKKSIAIREVLADVYLRVMQPDRALEKYKEIIELAPDRLDDMIVRLRRLLKNYPNHPLALFELSSALTKKHQFSEAVETLERFYKSVPEGLEQAISGFKQVLELFPEQVLAHQFLAEAYLKKGLVKEALQAFKKAVQIDASSIDTILIKVKEVVSSHSGMLMAQQVLGEIYIMKGDFRQALTMAESILSAEPASWQAYLLMGDAYMGLRLSKKAKDAYLLALKANPFNREIHEKLDQVGKRETELEIEAVNKQIQESPWRTALHLDLGKLFLNEQDMESAVRELQLATKDYTRAPFAYNLLGQAFKEDGRFDMAILQFEKALEVMPAELSELAKNVRFNLAATCEAQGNLAKAIGTYDLILQEDVNFANLAARIKLLKAGRLSNIRNRKILAVRRAISSGQIMGIWGQEAKNLRKSAKSQDEINISFGQSHNNTGFDYFMKNMHEGAREEFSLAVELDVKFSPALNNLGVLLAMRGNFDDARAKVLSAANVEDDSAVYLNNLGVIYSLQDEFAPAETSLRQALSFSPFCGAIFINLGDVLYLSGKIHEAIETYKKAPAFDILRELLDRRLRHKLP